MPLAFLVAARMPVFAIYRDWMARNFVRNRCMYPNLSPIRGVMPSLLPIRARMSKERYMGFIRKLVVYLNKDIWRVRAKKLPRRKSLFITWVRVVLLAVREFKSNQCQLNASALTFYSLLSVVPIAAVAFGVAQGFGFEKLLEKQLLEKFPGQQETITQIIVFANNLLENTRGGLIAGLGVILLFWTVIKVLDNVEASFNDIWGVKKGRSFGRKISDYLALILICPLLLIASGGATVFVATQVQMLIQKLAFLGYFEWAVVFGLKLIPFVMSWLLFTFLYIFMPNTKVNLVSGIVGGVVAGTIYQATQMVYVTFQVGAAKANAIYGSFAALPLFLIWLQLSWRIVLFGTELVFAHQNVDTYEFEHDCRNASPEMRGILGCEIAGVVAKRFKSGLAPFSASELADELDIPIRLVWDVS